MCQVFTFQVLKVLGNLCQYVQSSGSFSTTSFPLTFILRYFFLPHLLLSNLLEVAPLNMVRLLLTEAALSSGSIGVKDVI